MTLVSMKVYYK